MKQLKQLIWQTALMCALILSVPYSAHAQNASRSEVKGLVVDQKDLPVVGASVIVKGTMNGTITDESGNFAIETSAKDVLEVSCIGYETQTITVGSRSSFKVVLKEDSEFLDEVVVVGFGVQKKVNLTGSVSSIDMDKVLKNRPIGDVGAALQGAMPGLQVTSQNAMPGTAPQFNVRGFTSINGGSPLVLVDNVPMDLAMVDPADIDNVSVLKDAASSAIYGARAAYGVILITTKKGKAKDKIQVSYNNNFAFSNAINLPEKVSPLEEITAFKDMGVVNVNRVGWNVDKYLGYLEDYQVNPQNYEGGMAYDEKGVRYPLKDNDLIGLMMDKFGFQHKHNVALQGIVGKNSYRVSFGYLDEDGILYTNKDRYKRYNLSAFWKSEPAKWLDVSADVKYADSFRSYVDSGLRSHLFGAAVKMSSYAPVDPVEKDGVVYHQEISRSALILCEPVKQNERNLRILGAVNIKPVKGLTISGEYSYMFSNAMSNNYENVVRYQELNQKIRANRPYSTFTKSTGMDRWSTLNAFATYTNNINGHDFTIMAGYNQESKNSESMEVSKQDVIVDDLPSISQATGKLTAEDNYSAFSTRSLFYRLNYSYKNRYLVETSGRYDGSSRFPANHRFGFFPSGSVAWRIDQENFAKADWFSLGKIRASVGTIGNQSIANYAFIPTMDSYLSSWLVDGAQVVALKAPAMISPNFTWETVVTYDVGVDLRFWDRLSASYVYYIRDTKNMLTEAMQLPSVLGTTAPKENAADVRTNGWELEVSWKDVIGDWAYNIGFNLYDSRSRITRFDNEVYLLSNHYVGEEIGELWGYQTAGLYKEEYFKDGKLIQEFDENGRLIAGYPKVEGYNPNPGDILYVDQNGDGIINKGKNTLKDPGDQVKIGNKNRRLQYAINGGFSWKGLDFSFILTGIGKRDLWQSNEMIFPFFTPFSSMMKYQLDYWTPDNPNAFYPRMYEKCRGNTAANRYQQSRFLLNGSYLKIKNISLAYTFPKEMMQKIRISGLSLFVSAENVHTFYKVPKGINPESSSSQMGWYYPEMMKISFGLNLTL